MADVEQADGEQADIAGLKRPASGDAGCVEIAFVGDTVLVRHSKHPGGARISYSRAEWDALLTGVRGGTFDIRP